MKRVVANGIQIDHAKREIMVDGVTLPWHLAEPGPVVEEIEGVPMLIVHIPVVVDGYVHVRLGGSARPVVFDPVLGNVAEYAEREVRRQFREAYPDLELP